jgi:hypothetical protein
VAKHITAFTKVDPQNIFLAVDMAAENLGQHSTQHGHCCCYSGEKHHELHLTSSIKKSTEVRFVYDKNEKPGFK